jgi:hypothetical protein
VYVNERRPYAHSVISKTRKYGGKHIEEFKGGGNFEPRREIPRAPTLAWHEFLH